MSPFSLFFFNFGPLDPINCSYYRPQTKLRKGYVFTPVCHSVHRRGDVYPSACWDTPPWADTPRQTLLWADTPWVDTPPADTHRRQTYTGRHPRQTPLGRHPAGQTPPQADTPPPSRQLLQRTVRILLECILVFVRPLILLFWTSGDVCPGFQYQSGFLALV